MSGSDPYLRSPNGVKKDQPPKIEGHQLALYTPEAAKLFDAHLVAVKRIANGKIVDECP
ncbi:hypothetical protein [Xenorhabdus stockiae]|uniref:hypothetical protein n=1 Tax=Xenorhabdus stockiae TaxID=351614 RepID=UPI001476775B|nr:hypothetical protein [Xenorhabdus stockiae]